MAYSNRRLIPQSLQDHFLNSLSPLTSLFAKWGFSPNSFTVAGVVITSFGAAACATGFTRLAGILILFGGLCDTIDGSIARTAGKSSRLGALLDSTVDRYSEFIMYLGIGAYFIKFEDYSTAAGTFLALCGSIMVSYARARGENLGFEAKTGFMQRPERIVVIGMGALIHVTFLKLAIWLVAIFANFTVIQRIQCAYKQDSSEMTGDAVLDIKKNLRNLRVENFDPHRNK